MKSLTRFSLLPMSFAALLARAQAVRSEKKMSLEPANQIAAAGVAACQAISHSVAATVVDPADSVRAVQRADNDGPHSLASSQQKAFTLPSLKSSTLAIKETAQKNPGTASLVYLPGVLAGACQSRWATKASVLWALAVHRGANSTSNAQCLAALATAAAICAAAMPAAAQMPPTPVEAAAYSGLHAAAQRGDVAAVKRLAAASRAVRESRDAHGRTPLHVATFARQRGAVEALLAAGAHAGALEDDRYDAVTIAAVADDEETLRLLLANGASAKLVTSRYEGTALIAAAHLGHDGVVRQLIAAGAPLNHVNNLHWTALIEAIVLGNGGARHQATLSALLQAGASTQLTDREGRTPLQLARIRGYAAMVQMLVSAGMK